MAKIYAALIRKGIKTLDEVPARLRSTVKALLAANGISAVSEQDEETEEPDETERTRQNGNQTVQPRQGRCQAAGAGL